MGSIMLMGPKVGLVMGHKPLVSTGLHDATSPRLALDPIQA